MANPIAVTVFYHRSHKRAPRIDDFLIIGWGSERDQMARIQGHVAQHRVEMVKSSRERDSQAQVCQPSIQSRYSSTGSERGSTNSI
jgi:hypothetical protein